VILMSRRRALSWVSLPLLVISVILALTPASTSTALGSPPRRAPVLAPYSYDGVRQLSAGTSLPRLATLPEHVAGGRPAAVVDADLTGEATTGFAAEETASAGASIGPGAASVKDPHSV
jgi:hypothetical protein